MAWPTTLPNLTNLDTPATDKPLDAVNDLYELAQIVTDIITAKGIASGVADLDTSGAVPLSRIPVIDVTRGGHGGTNASQGRAGLGLGTAATKDVNVASGVANLNADKEARQIYKGAAAAPNGYVLYSDGSWAPPYPTSAGWITQAMLKSASGTVTGGSVGSFGNLTLPGGQYGFEPQVRASNGTVIGTVITGQTNSGSWAARIAFEVDSPGQEGGARQRYIQSSPPYNLGDDDIPLFVFVGFLDGEIAGVWEAQDPPWALNGLTDIHSGVKMLSMDEWKDPYIREPFLDKLMADEIEPVAEGMTLKNYDMPDLPTPFDSHVHTVLLDPVGDEIRRLYEIQRRGGVIADLIKSGALKVDNDPLKRCGPPGVDVVRARWA